MNTKLKSLVLSGLLAMGLASCTKFEPKLLKADGEWDIVHSVTTLTVNDTLQGTTTLTDSLGYLAFQDDYEGIHFDNNGDTLDWFTWGIDENLDKLRYTSPLSGMEFIYDILKLNKQKMELHTLHIDNNGIDVTQMDISLSLERRE